LDLEVSIGTKKKKEKGTGYGDPEKKMEGS
jgi:hypothetical protein